ncbi:hypothetical protein FOT62_22515 [Serratia marcescens]|uniref:Uncharacterized protein n=1 Tax=Serratia marcescens TaxID=615 RepID=A0A5C7BXR6_SERMA|nr:hypothetical protein [Serratia marcescens]TXE27346.1 hypothetical protein FOT62_22515 [Serratia marcescens]TXE55522.1 hypothetical protein FOT56_25010 [Serratia marcescens]
MKFSYRITKYKKYDPFGNLCSSDDEWTSFFDIGQKVSKSEYEMVEKEYVDFVINACNLFSAVGLCIKELEVNVDFFKYKNNDVVRGGDLEEVIRSILREDVWCKLVSDSFEFHFGYDFYMYFIFDAKNDDLIHEIRTSLTVQSYKSPYE